MRQEANPRKFLRRALDYGASPCPITVSHSGSLHSTVAASSPSRIFRATKSSKSVSHAAKPIA